MDLSDFASSTVTVGELLRNQQELESQAAETLGFSIDECTHTKHPEGLCQAIYSCLTCRKETGERAGVCACCVDSRDPRPSRAGTPGSACSIQCHAEHELVELLQRRNFICDCGTTKLGKEATCRLDKRLAQDPNTSNRYDHNFDGRFCECRTLYDPEQEESDMFQCTICEDWFHAACQTPDLKLPEEEWDGYICRDCVQGPAGPLLKRWAGVAGRGVLTIGDDGNVSGLLKEAPHKRAASTDPEPEAKRLKVEHPHLIPVALPLASVSTSAPVPIERADGKTCIAPPVPGSSKMIEGPVLLEDGWRDRWCRCVDCLPAFRDLPMLLEPDQVYEPAADPEAKKSLVELGLQALQNLPREQVIEGLLRYNQMRDGLLAHLAPLSQAGEVVTKEAIEQFFAEQRERDASL